LAESLVANLKSTAGRAHLLETIELIPSGGGVFEVSSNEELIFSKKQSGRFPSSTEILDLVRGRLKDA
jgi:selenoprotein W-related protein